MIEISLQQVVTACKQTFIRKYVLQHKSASTIIILSTSVK